VFVRGIGLGFTMMPAIASAYALLERGEVPRATPMLNVLQRVGGSIGVALLAVVLEHQLRSALGGLAPGGASVHSLPTAARARLSEPIARAFAQTYWWALALTVVALVPAFVLLRAQRGRPEAGPEGVSERLPAPVG
jgi:hypothetical protein